MRYAILELDPIQVQDFDTPDDKVWIHYTDKWFNLTPQEAFRKASYAKNIKEAIFRLYDDFLKYRQCGPYLIKHLIDIEYVVPLNFLVYLSLSDSPAAADYICNFIKNEPLMPACCLFSISKRVVDIAEKNIHKLVLFNIPINDAHYISFRIYTQYTNIKDLMSHYEYIHEKSKHEDMKKYQVSYKNFDDIVGCYVAIYRYGFYFHDGEQLVKYCPDMADDIHLIINIYLGAMSNNNLKMMKWCWHKMCLLLEEKNILGYFSYILTLIRDYKHTFNFEKTNVETIKIFLNHIGNIAKSRKFILEMIDLMVYMGQYNVNMFAALLDEYLLRNNEKDIIKLYKIIERFSIGNNPSCMFYVHLKLSISPKVVQNYNGKYILEQNPGPTQYKLLQEQHVYELYTILDAKQDPYNMITETFKSFQLAKHTINQACNDMKKRYIAYINGEETMYRQTLKEIVSDLLDTCENNHRKKMLQSLYQKEQI